MTAITGTRGLVYALVGLLLLGLGRSLLVAALAIILLAIVLVLRLQARHQRRAIGCEP